ncbi:response regulator [candidate division KSB1 bacterium]|nr:response regulator [candidate division KSB1 bacterium]
MNILYLEDRGSVSFYISEFLEHKGHTVYPAFSIMEARSIIEEHKIDVIILDLNLNPDGLKEEEIEKTLNGIITGWIWFNNYVLSKNPKMKDNVIILSEYLNVLEEAYGNETSDIKKIAKRGFPSPISQLTKKIDEIESQLK